jgi:hypothetical protein
LSFSLGRSLDGQPIAEGHSVTACDLTAQLKPAMYLRGMERILMDLALEPAIAEAIIERIVSYYLDYNRPHASQYAEAGSHGDSNEERADSRKGMPSEGQLHNLL